MRSPGAIPFTGILTMLIQPVFREFGDRAFLYLLDGLKGWV
ncbi:MULTISPECIES: hypothetical protein [Paenibacillus]|nr:hypothetical protein [Paenibacillus odorifer]